MKLLSDLYNVTLKRGIRGAAKGGFVRPTIGQNFMTHKDFEEIESIVPEAISYPAFNNLSSPLYVQWDCHYNAGSRSNDNPIYEVPTGFTYRAIDFRNTNNPGHPGYNISGDGKSITGSYWGSIWISNNAIETRTYLEIVQIAGDYPADVHIRYGVTNLSLSWTLDYYGRYGHDGVSTRVAGEFKDPGGVLGMAVDPEEGKIWWSRNGVWMPDLNGNLATIH